MRYMVYGDDAASRQPREPLVVDADSEGEARGRAVARGMAVRAVIAEEVPTEAPAAARQEQRTPESDDMRGIRRSVLMVLLPLVIGFFLIIAVLRTLVQAATWTTVWALGLIVGGGIAGLLVWFSDRALPPERAWQIGLVAGLMTISALYGTQRAWLGIAATDADSLPRTGLRVPVMLAQGIAGGFLGALISVTGEATDWHVLTVLAGTVGGSLGLGLAGAAIGADLAGRKPAVVPGGAATPSFESLAGILARVWGEKHLYRSWVIGYALDRAAPGAVAGTFIGAAAALLGAFVVR